MADCPVEGCGYNKGMKLLGEAQAKPLVLESTRSHASEGAWRDMDHFDLNEELARLRRAVHEVRQNLLYRPSGRHEAWKIHRSVTAEEMVGLLAFISEAFDNIDENLVREGPLPDAWVRPPQREPTAEEMKHMDVKPDTET